MNKFSELGIIAAKRFSGKKIEIEEVFGKPVTVQAWRIKPSKYPEKGNGMRLELQIEFNSEQRVIFTGSVVLQELIEQVPDEKFPFSTIIVKQNKAIHFT